METVIAWLSTLAWLEESIAQQVIPEQHERSAIHGIWCTCTILAVPTRKSTESSIFLFPPIFLLFSSTLVS